tara:strand:- start:514 stop:732 length:219 start_codon:yes stop_codon:yes gene_type:complete
MRVQLGDIVKYQNRFHNVYLGTVVENCGQLGKTTVWQIQRFRPERFRQREPGIIREHVLEGDILTVMNREDK